MLNSNLPEPDLLKAILEPLLDDFQYWLERSAKLLESEEIPFLSFEEHSDLLARVKQAQQEVTAAQTLFHATDAQIGIETAALLPWHQLLTECWQITMRYRLEQSALPGK